MPDLTPADWDAIVDALHYAAEEVAYDLHDTRNSDFYDPEERADRESMYKNWERLARAVAPQRHGGDE